MLEIIHVYGQAITKGLVDENQISYFQSLEKNSFFGCIVCFNVDLNFNFCCLLKIYIFVLGRMTVLITSLLPFHASG